VPFIAANAPAARTREICMRANSGFSALLLSAVCAMISALSFFLIPVMKVEVKLNGMLPA
jgi:hypothetical protein